MGEYSVHLPALSCQVRVHIALQSDVGVSESKPTEPRCYRKSIKAYLKQSTIRQVRPHALRHTFATTCLQAGCDVKTLSELLGHANANITLQRYVHSDLTRKRREMNRIFSHQVSVKGRRTLNLKE